MISLRADCSYPKLIINLKPQISNLKSMKKETWKTIIQVIVSILTAALTALGTTSCMGYGPIAF